MWRSRHTRNSQRLSDPVGISQSDGSGLMLFQVVTLSRGTVSHQHLWRQLIVPHIAKGSCGALATISPFAA